MSVKGTYLNWTGCTQDTTPARNTRLTEIENIK